MSEDSQDPASPDDGAVLSPEELDISDEENVVELEEGRYVISPGGGEPNVSNSADPSPEPASSDLVDDDPAPDLSEADVHDWLETRLDAADSKYAFDVTASFEGRVSQKALFSNDVVTTFENLVAWYAHHAGGDTPVEDVLGILMVESNLSVRFPADSLRTFAESQGLHGQDSLESLFEAAREAGGIRFSAEHG